MSRPYFASPATLRDYRESSLLRDCHKKGAYILHFNFGNDNNVDSCCNGPSETPVHQANMAIRIAPLSEQALRSQAYEA